MKMAKKFDCVKMKDEAQQRRAVALGGQPDECRLEFYRQAHEALVLRQKELRERSGGTA